MSTPIIKVRDIAFPRLSVPDLDQAEAFLLDFGLTRSARTDTALYMRGSGPNHHVHVCELGESAALLGFAFYADSLGDLETLAQASGASVEDTGEPGGGSRVRLTDPNGYVVDVVHGIEEVEPGKDRSLPLNLGGRVERKSAVKRVLGQLPVVRRLGHAGINVPDTEATFAWYQRHLGLLHSDVIAIDGLTIAMFCRCDRGEELTDHHTFLVALSMDGTTGLNHASWEVADLDDIWLGYDRLHAGGHQHSWGVGRHTLGSQVFDYWRDPWGQIHEHFTDGDLVNDSHQVSHGGPEGAASQWGPTMPEDFGHTA